MTFESAIAFAVNIFEEPILPNAKLPELTSLTSREREVLLLLSKGLTNEQISSQLVVVQKTVEKHVANILMKLGVKNRTEAAAWVMENKVTK